MIEKNGELGLRYRAFAIIKSKVSEKINKAARTGTQNQLVQRANYLVKNVLEDAYDFLTESMMLSLDEDSLLCDCMACPENFKFNPNSKHVLDQVSFKVDLLAQLIDPDSIQVNEALKDIQTEPLDEAINSQIRERIRDELVDLQEDEALEPSLMDQLRVIT